jgi:ATP-binding cassette subfamily B protein
MDAGRIVEQGTHEQLIAALGHYAQLWQLQLQSDEDATSRV